MDRNAPAGLLDTAQRGYDESKALIERWHGNGRLRLRRSRRASRSTSTPAQLDAAGALEARASPTCTCSRTCRRTWPRSRSWRRCFPKPRRYLDVYARHGLTGPRTIYGHGVHLDERDFAFLHETGTALAHCPTSNNFLGSGLFTLATATRRDRPVRVGLATDLGGGTSFSILRTMQAAYEVAQLAGAPLPPSCALYLATRGAARALDLDDRIGSVAPGMEADVVVLDLASTPLIDDAHGVRARHRRGARGPDGAGRRPRDPRDVRRGALRARSRRADTASPQGLSGKIALRRTAARGLEPPATKVSLPCPP